MNLKAIVLDIDGTLLTEEKVISVRTKQALIEAQIQGVKVILASGRPTSGMRHLVEELEMNHHHGLIVSYNGACVIDCENDEILFNQTMSVTEVKAVLRHLEQFEVTPMIEKGDYMLVDDVYDCWLNLPQGPFNVIQYESRGGGYLLCEVANLADAIDIPLNKILVAGDPQYMKDHESQIAQPFIEQLSSMFTAPFYYEFTAKNIDKAFALDTVLHQFNIHASEIIAFGDGHNDLSLIRYAGKGVAMGNAVDALKAAADVITASHNEEGIALIVEEYLNR